VDARAIQQTKTGRQGHRHGSLQSDRGLGARIVLRRDLGEVEFVYHFTTATVRWSSLGSPGDRDVPMHEVGQVRVTTEEDETAGPVLRH
jgi:hypothetical protein